MFKAATIFFYVIICSTLLHAQSVKYEFRGAWVATVGNIDWPSKPGLPPSEQQQQFLYRLDQLKSLGCNAVIVQIRPVADAFYASKIEPWSRYLTGTQGEAPDPFYDPLVFMIEETHKRNMEFHAWFNPFRASMDNKKIQSPGHVTRKHPEWIVNYGPQSIIDPGIPEAREYVLSVMTDVVKRYDIDAVHLDDYFYPYPLPKVAFGDTKTYAKYGDGMSKEDWRRSNVNKFIFQLNKRIKDTKPYVKLGISPFGIWRNKNKDIEGSETKGGLTNYDDLYADVLLWMQKGWIDYLMPQLYWDHNHKVAPFGVLMPWWYGHCYKRHIFYGLGLYHMAESHSGPWTGINELLWQIRDIRGACPNSGFCFYNASSFDKLKVPLKDSLQQNYGKYPALIPPMIWLDSVAPAAPTVKISVSAGVAALTWQESNPAKEPLKYVVSRFVNNEPVNLERNDKIISIQQGMQYTDTDVKRYKHCTYVVTALDRLWNESKPSAKVLWPAN